MPNDLPPPVATYVEANARLDAEGMLAPFAEDAVVLDHGRRHAGHDEIRTWIRSETIRSNAVFTPGTSRERDGRVVVEGLTAGAFPGSPIRFTFVFEIRGETITALEIA
ncbi:nuclear transport factor 2 family protein [Pararoseomonas sp. SCSIO 73927]|uniref:nuclear transport factor 2 family protein n=1 Tax=Pararoseomonas sp. SCSIO 73927 TaxID=3114537 RepID=UPI0030D51468